MAGLGRPFDFDESPCFARASARTAFLEGPCACDCDCDGAVSRAFFGPDAPGGRRGGGLLSRLRTAFVDFGACIVSSRTLTVCDGRPPSSFASTAGLEVFPVFFFRSALTAPTVRLGPVPAFDEPVPVEPGRVRT